MSTITGVSDITLTSAVAALSATPDSAPVDKWRLTPVTAGAVPSDVYFVERTDATVDLYFSPALSSSATYTLSVTTTTGGTPTTSTQNFTAPTQTRSLGAEWSHGVLRAWSRAVTQAIQEFSGVTATMNTQDIRPEESAIYVESTLGFPESGHIFVGAARYRYTSRGPAAFYGVTRDEPTTRVERRKQVVYLDISSIYPTGGTELLTTFDRPYTDPNGVL